MFHCLTFYKYVKKQKFCRGKREKIDPDDLLHETLTKKTWISSMTFNVLC